MGKLYGIGVGPGDPELLTRKACRLLREADVIFCPVKEAGERSFAYEIVKEQADEGKAEIVFLVYPMHYHGERLRELWEENAKQIAARLDGGRTGVFVTLGDPAIYSTLMYTFPYVEERGIETEIVPGVPSFCAAAASMKWPLAAWNEELLIAPLRRQDSARLKKLFAEHENVVLMKPSSDRQALLGALEERGLTDRFALVLYAGTGEERCITDFEELKTAEIPYFSTLIVKRK